MKPDFNYHGKVIVLDLDDTLARERDYVRSGIRLAMEELRNEPGVTAAFDAEVAESLMTNALEHRQQYYTRLEQYLESLEADPKQWMGKVVDTIRNHESTDYRLFPDAKIFLDKLRRDGIVIGLATDGRSTTQRAKIKMLGLDEYIRPENIVISEESGHDKHDPDNFIMFVDRYPEAESFTYIGDNPEKDFLHPNLLGWHTVCRLDPEDRNVHHQDFEREEIYLPERRVVLFSEV